MASKKKDVLWWVKHPDHTVAVVIADSWEQATVEAAKWWDVPWKTVAALCECEKKEELRRGVCCDCGGLLWNPEGVRARCGKCESIARAEEQSRKARNERFFREMCTR